MMRSVVVLVTASDLKEARLLTRTLVREKRVACATLVPRVESTYWWKGKMETAEEVLLIMKTSASHMKGLIRRVRQLHSYSVPEVLALPVAAGNPDYLAWLAASVKNPKK